MLLAARCGRILWSACAGPGRVERLLAGERQVSSGRKAKSARAQRREAERREAATVRRLEARVRVLTYEPAELDQLMSRLNSTRRWDSSRGCLTLP